METRERKFNVILKEWKQINAAIYTTGDYKFKVRGWCITIFAGIFAISIHQGEKDAVILAIFTTILFWLFDAMHQFVQNRFCKREKEIEKILNEPTDDNIMNVVSPNMRDNLINSEIFDRSFLKIVFGIFRVYMFGSMLLLSLVYYFMPYLCRRCRVHCRTELATLYYLSADLQGGAAGIGTKCECHSSSIKRKETNPSNIHRARGKTRPPVPKRRQVNQVTA